MKKITQITLIFILLSTSIFGQNNTADSTKIAKKENEIKTFVKSKDFKTVKKFLKQKANKTDKSKINEIFDSINLVYKKIVFDSLYLYGLSIADKIETIKKCKININFINSYYRMDELIKTDTNYINLKERPFDKNYKQFQFTLLKSKKKRMLLITEELKDQNEVFMQINAEIKKNNPLIDDKFLDGVYFDIFSFAQKVSDVKNPKYKKTKLLYLGLVYYYYQKCD